MPCLLDVGEGDPRLPQMRECMKHLANATFLSSAELGHVDAPRSERSGVASRGSFFSQGFNNDSRMKGFQSEEDDGRKSRL